MSKSDTSTSRTVVILTDLGIALGVVCLVMAGEYFFRHYVLFWLPTIGSLLVNDMLSLFLVYALLLAGIGALRRTDWRRELAGLWQAFQENTRSWKFVGWFMLMALSIFVLPVFDRLLASRFTLPMIINSYRSPFLWLARFAPVLKVVSEIAVNGIFAPVAEEYLWRGIVQDRFLRLLPAWLAIGITAVLFSFKHVLVDASWGRFLTLIAFGIICGIVARQKDWKSSAVLHILVNTIATLMALIMGGI
jgi:membrane protease YdiL (CAAX protease family)